MSDQIPIRPSGNDPKSSFPERRAPIKFEEPVFPEFFCITKNSFLTFNLCISKKQEKLRKDTFQSTLKRNISK